MNIYENELLEERPEECIDLLVHLLLDLLLASLRKMTKESQTFSDLADSQLSDRMDIEAF